MNKRGQFYLLTTIIIIGLIFSFATVINYSQGKSSINFDYLKDELNIESENVMDNALSNNLDMKDTLINFSKSYSTYSEADNFYFIFGDRNEITVAGYQSKSDGSIFVNVGSGNQELSLNKKIYNSKDFLNPQRNINVSINDFAYDFSLSSGENFYFILSKEINGEVHIVTNIYYNESVVFGSGGNDTANFNATYSNIQKNFGSNPSPSFCVSGWNWWYFNTTLQELDGIVGITVNQRQKCYEFPILSNYCDIVKTDITNKFGTDYISSGGQIFDEDSWICTDDSSMTVTETFWGIDNNGNNVQDSYSFTTS